MKGLQESLLEELEPINESRKMWVVEWIPDDPNGVFTGLVKAICSSEKAARVWCVEFSEIYPAWKLRYDMYSNLITGLWNPKSGDELVIRQHEVQTKEKTYLKEVD